MGTRNFRRMDQFMASLGDKEATYDAGPAAWTLGAAFQLHEIGEGLVEWADTVVTDRETVHGTQHATFSELVRKDARFSYTEPRVRPHSLAGWAALTGGVVTSTQDGAFAAYRHKITPIAANLALPSIGIQEKSAGEQKKYTGVCADRLNLKRAGALWSLDLSMIGSGTRADAADAMPTKILDPYLPWSKTKSWLESGANISIAATPTQGTQDISAGTPKNLSLARMLDAEFWWTNDLQGEHGYTPSGALAKSDLPHGQGRMGHFRTTLLVETSELANERAYFENQTKLAIEIEVDTGTIIAAGGAMKYGFDLIIPSTRLSGSVRAVDTGFVTLTLEGDTFDDGINPPFILYVYAAQSAYLV